MWKSGVKVGVVLAIVFAAWQFGHAQARLADFKITVEPSASGAKFECSKGCAWEKLSFSCDGKQPCKAQVDQTGVTPIVVK